MIRYIPRLYHGLVVVAVGQLDVVADLHGDGGGIALAEAVDQRIRRHLRRRGAAAGGDELVGRRHDRAAEHSQHD